jgi:hypothetical protein
MMAFNPARPGKKGERQANETSPELTYCRLRIFFSARYGRNRETGRGHRPLPRRAVDSFEEESVKDINEVLRRKIAQQAQLKKQIEALESVSKDLEKVAHLLEDDEREPSATPRR